MHDSVWLSGELRKQLKEIGQEHLAQGLEELSEEQLQAFYHQLNKYPLSFLVEQKKILVPKNSIQEEAISPLEDYATAGNFFHEEKGWELLSQGKAACLILAGGQGTRLNFAKSKGFFPISLVKKKTFFQLFCEKTFFASQKVGRKLSLAFMTSPLNDEDIRTFFRRNRYFGLDEEQIDFFPQETAPFLTDNGEWLLESPGHLAEGPDGNGDALRLLARHGILEKWLSQGVEYVNVLLIDNPLADPFDAELLGFHAHTAVEVTIKAVPRLHAEEKVGVLGVKNNKTQVIEYTELSKQATTAKTSQGQLLFPLANIGLYCFKADFIRTISQDSTYRLPWHGARKKIAWGTSSSREIWKCEKFIFDLLPFAKQVNVLVYPRETCFAPLKNLTGEASINEVQRALFKRDCQIYERISSLRSEKEKFELSLAFHYPTTILLDKWRGKPLPVESDYIEP